jgi:hypothetical protein
MLPSRHHLTSSPLSSFLLAAHWSYLDQSVSRTDVPPGSGGGYWEASVAVKLVELETFWKTAELLGKTTLTRVSMNLICSSRSRCGEMTKRRLGKVSDFDPQDIFKDSPTHPEAEYKSQAQTRFSPITVPLIPSAHRRHERSCDKSSIAQDLRKTEDETGEQGMPLGTPSGRS